MTSDSERAAKQAKIRAEELPRFIGLTEDGAIALAEELGRQLRVMRGSITLDLRPYRVNVWLGEDGRVTKTELC